MDERVLLATGAPIPINSSLLAPVASSGRYSDLEGTLTSLTQLQNDLTGVGAGFSVPGTLTTTHLVSVGPTPISINGSLQATTNNVTASQLTTTGQFTCQGTGTFNQTLSVSGSLTCGSVFRAQGVQVPRTTFGTVSAGTITLAPGASGTVAAAYGVTYANQPSVSVAVHGAAGPVFATVEAATKTGFNAVLHNLALGTYTGSPIVSWQAAALA